MIHGFEKFADGVSLQALYCAHASRLVRYIDGLIPLDLRAVIDAQDVAQDAFFQAARTQDPLQFSEPDSDWRWIATIGRNRLVDIIEANQAAKRGGRLKQFREDELHHGSVIVMLQDLAAHERTPSKSAVRREFVVLLERSLGRLQPDYRDAIRMRYIEGMSLHETADRLSRSEESTKKLCMRGLKALRAELRAISFQL